MKKTFLAITLISCLVGMALLPTAALAYELSDNNAIFFSGVETYKPNNGSIIADPDWLGLALDFDIWDLGFRLGASANLQYDQYPEEAFYTLGGSARYLKLLSLIAILDFDAAFFMQNVGYGNELGWSANAKFSVARAAITINSGSVGENYDSTPLKLMLRDKYFVNDSKEPENLWWINATLAIQSSSTRRDSLTYGFTGSHYEEGLGRHDIGYDMKYSFVDAGVSLNVYTGLAISKGLPITFINEFSLAVYTSNNSGAEISMLSQNGVGGQAMSLSAAAWVVFDNFGIMKATFTTPLGTNDWADDPAIVLYKPISGMEVGLSLTPYEGTISSVDASYKFDAQHLKVGLSYRF